MTSYIALSQNTVPTIKLLPHKNAIKIVPNKRHFAGRKYQTRNGAKPHVAQANISFFPFTGSISKQDALGNYP